MEQFLKRLGSLSLTIAFIALLLGAIAVSMIRLLSPLVAYYKTEIENWASHFLDQPVVIGSLNLSWYRLEPVVKLKQIQLLSKQEAATVVQLDELQIGFDFLKSFLERKWYLEALAVKGMTLEVTQSATGSWLVNNSFAWSPQHQPVEGAAIAQIVDEVFNLLTKQELHLEDINVNWENQAGDRLQLANLALTVVKQQHGHHVEGAATVVQKQRAAPVTFALDIPMNASSQSDEAAYFYVKLGHLSLTELVAARSGYGAQLISGNIESEIWGVWQAEQLQEVRAQAFLDNLILKSVEDQQEYSAHRLAGQFQWQKAGTEHWQLAVANLEITTADTASATAKASFVLDVTTEPEYKATWRFAHLDAGIVRLLLPFRDLWPSEGHALLTTLRPEGQFTQGLLHWENKALTGYLEFEQLGWQALQGLPGTTGLSGYLEFLPDKGHLFLDSKAVEIVAEEVYSRPLSFSQLTGYVHWEQQPAGWSVTIPQFKLQAEDGVLLAEATAMFPTEGSFSPVVDGLVQLQLPKADALTHYYPAKVMPPDVVDWLQESIKDGRNLNATMVIRGPIKAFPFKQQEGVFLVTGEVEDGLLDYVPGWPPIEQLDAKLTYEEDTLTIEAKHGYILGGALHQAVATITNIVGDEPSLLIMQGEIEADSAQAMRLLKEGPLAEELGPEVAPVELAGPLLLDLDMTIPLRTMPEGITLEGRAKLTNNVMTLPEYRMRFDQVTGNLAFTEDKLVAERVTAQLWQQPFQMSITTQTENGALKTEVDLEGILPMKDLWTYLDIAMFSQWLTGKADYRGKLILYSQKAASQPHQLMLTSRLAGVTVTLPGELSKPEHTGRLLDFSLHFGQSFPWQLKLDYGQVAHLDLTWQQKSAQQLTMQGQLQIDMTDAEGTVKFYRDDAEQWYLNADWQALQLSFLEVLKNDSIFETAPSSFPTVSFACESCTYNHYWLGEVRFALSPEKDGFVLKDIAIVNPAYQVTAAGRWQRGASQGTTHLAGELTSHDMLSLLKAWELPPLLSSERVQLNADVYWPGLPHQFALAKAEGEIEVELGAGVINEISPDTSAKLGLGRLLTIFSLKTLPRLLTLNFKDLTSNGYNFDKMRGSFTLRQANLYTANTYFNGPIAYVGIEGRTGLATKDYNLQVRIIPYVTSSLPVLVFLINPLAGAATWAAEALVGNEVSKLASYTYTLKGDWADPLIELVEQAE